MNETEILDALKMGICDILHEVAPGRNKLVKVTLQQNYFSKPLTRELVENQVAELDRHDGVRFRCLHAWDVIGKDWTTFRLDKVLSVQLNQS